MKTFEDLLFQNWWSVLLRGILAMLFGLAIVVWPGMALLALILTFSAYLLLDGAATIVGSFVRRHQEHHFPLALFLSGLLSVAAGLAVFFWPALTALTLLYLIAAWATLRGVLEIAAGIEFRKVIQHEWLLILGGLASIVFGILAFAWPGTGILAMLWLLGTYVILYGLLAVVLSVRLHDLHRPFGAAGPTAA